MPTLHTPRLDLYVYSHALMQATLIAPSRVGEQLDLNAASDWPNPSFAEVLPRIAAPLLQHPSLAQLQRLIIRRDTATIIGEIGFKYLPIRGETEVGYGICASARSHGFATEALRAMCDFAVAQGIVMLHADCLWDNHASAAVLAKAGFREWQGTPVLRCWKRALIATGG